MLFRSLKRFRNGLAPTPLSPDLKKELVQDQLATLIQDPLLLPQVQDLINPLNVPENIINKNVLTKFMLWQARPTQPGTLSLHTIGAKTKEEWSKVKSAIDSGAPIILGLIRVQSNKPWDASNNHQVVAIGYSYNDLTKDVRLSLYDPNYVNFTSKISFNIGLPDNQIKASQVVPGGYSPVVVRGFFANPIGSGPPVKPVYMPAPTVTPSRLLKPPRTQ